MADVATPTPTLSELMAQLNTAQQALASHRLPVLQALAAKVATSDFPGLAAAFQAAVDVTAAGSTQLVFKTVADNLVGWSAMIDREIATTQLQIAAAAPTA